MDEGPFEKFNRIFHSHSQTAEPVETNAVGAEPVGVDSAYIEPEEIDWLVHSLGDTGEIRAETVELHTSHGTLVITADGDTVCVELEGEHDE
jgi:hypothetical protein